MGSARRVIYAPELCANACLLFSYTSAHDRSFCLRHHGAAGSLEIRREHCAEYVTTAWIQGRIRGEAAADRVPFENAGYWGARLAEYARQWVGAEAGEPAFNPAHFPGVRARAHRNPSAPAPGAACSFPFLDMELLLRSAKGMKPQDLERMTGSPNSEDYVTWALVCAWKRCRPDWWAALLRLAAEQAPGLETGVFGSCVPDVMPWLRLASPGAYERLSRARMAASPDRTLSARAADPRPVEGESEIDLAFVSPAFVVFVECKLGSDISQSTTYDPSRNQLVRNVDCALEHAAGRPAAVWLFVRDRAPSRLYTTLVKDYRRDPRQLHRLLPHRSPEEVEGMASRLAVLTWQDLLAALCPESDQQDLRDMLDEVQRRLSP
jgi:hypothetical protein